MLGADEIDLDTINKNAFIVYIGHHGDRAAEIADIILPAAVFTEKDATYVNLEGRVQNTYAAVDKVGSSKVDWQIILELAKRTNNQLPYNAIEEIRKSMQKVNSLFKKVGSVSKSILPKNSAKQINFSKDTVDEVKLNYYLSNPICRNSITMSKCVKTFIVK